MRHLKSTLKRSLTPTGAEMKAQSSLEVPQPIRSASFDDNQLEARRNKELVGPSAEAEVFLRVPPPTPTAGFSSRSQSIDISMPDDSSSSSEAPSRRFLRRISSSCKSQYCWHCKADKEHQRLHPPEPELELEDIPDEFLYYRDSSESESDDEEYFKMFKTPTVFLSQEITEPAPSISIYDPPPISITTTIEVHSPTNVSVSSSNFLSVPSTSTDPRFLPPQNEQSSSSHDNPLNLPSFSVTGEDIPNTSHYSRARRKSIIRQESFFVDPNTGSVESDCASEGAVSDNEDVRDYFLKVPDLRRDRARSVDSSFSQPNKAKTEELTHSGLFLEVPTTSTNASSRSRSIDIVLPTHEKERYKALLLTVPQDGKVEIDFRLVIRNTSDWSETAKNGDHVWAKTTESTEACQVGEHDCTKNAARVKCSCCNVVTHEQCLSMLMDRDKFFCKPTFRDVGVRQYREQTTHKHHWVHRRTEKGKCRACGKSFQSKLLRSKDIVAISCSWCKVSYHNKECCFDTDLIGEECKMGVHAGIIVPPSWIIKLPERGNFKSSLRKTSKKRRSKKKGREKDIEMALLSFIIKPIPTMFIIPIIIFINPKSGGNQGLMLTHKFQWLLNPRQVFDLTVGGPNLGLELYKRVPNLRVLACGGDGTVGWVLDVIDKIDIHPRPPVGVLPLGTGNDLARALGWGGGYTDEPISKILSHLSLSETISLDRWQLEVTPNDAGDKSDPAKENLPLNVVNNYFSLGVDAHIALEFHEAREAHPEKFNSRLRNKVFYGQMGGKDLLKRKWRDLSDHVTLECDGRDLTPKLKELKVHAIVFLNIPSYGGGTRPWNRSMGSHEQSTEDGYIEVVGLTTYQLPLLQAGGHGSAIAQCQTATLVTDKTIPMQVDGEACKLNPSVIKLSLLNKAPMLAKKKGKGVVHHAEIADLTINLHRLNIADYKAYHYEKNLLIDSAIKMGAFDINPTNDLEYVRSLINKFVDGLNDDEKISPDWCFVDSITAERFFRVDKAQENLHYITDICSDDLYILECADELQLLEDTTAVPSPSSAEKVPYNIPEMRVSYEGSLDSPSDYPTVSSSSTKSEEPSTSKTTQNGYSLSRDKQAEAMLNAAKVGDSTLIKLLHGQGCSLTSKDPAGQTVLHYAVRYGHMEIVKYILIYASDSVDVQETHLGQTALHKAVAYKWKELCGVLVAAGASLTIQDKKGLTPKMLAVHIGDPGIIAYLESQESFQKAYVQPGTNV